MKKTDKKMDNHIRRVLTDVCETSLKDINGFAWLTHTVNYAQFPQSLKVICVFDTLEELTTFLESEQYNLLNIRVRRELTTLDVSLKPNVKIVVYDTEEMCEQEHQNNWAKRLATL